VFAGAAFAFWRLGRRGRSVEDPAAEEEEAQASQHSD